jgi:hypothetical protein
MPSLLRGVGTVVLLVSVSYPGLAQLSTGSLSGSVTDPAGLAIPGATVKVLHVPTHL